MEIENRISAFVALGNALNNISGLELEELCSKARVNNPWFQPDDTMRSIKSIVSMLQKNKLLEWTSNYQDLNQKPVQTVGIVMAGNIPAVGFHDYLSTLISGRKVTIKLSSQDSVLLPFIHSVLMEIAPDLAKKATFTEKLVLNQLDAIIATGSDNSSRYFESYFSKLPSLIRKNRTSVAILTGKEKKEELKSLGRDVLWYYGLGCRNVSKLYVPENYDLTILLDAFEEFKDYAIYQNKYVNNYDYNKSIYLVNGVKHLDNGFLLLKEAKELVSPISVLHYEEYKEIGQLSLDQEKVQCIVGTENIPFGKAQFPELWDYADGVDVIQFLNQLA